MASSTHMFVVSDQSNAPAQVELQNKLFDASVLSIPLPAKNNEERSNKNGVVVPGETTLVPLWIRGDRIGKQILVFVSI